MTAPVGPAIAIPAQHLCRIPLRVPRALVAMLAALSISQAHADSTGGVCVRAGENPLALQQIVARGRLEYTGDRNGRPRGARRLEYLSLLFPKAVAARANDVFIYDAGHRTIFKFDRALRTLTEFTRTSAGQPDVDLYVDDDRSVFVVDSDKGDVRQYGPHGELLQQYSDAENLRRPIAVVVGPNPTEILVADGFKAIVLAFNRLGAVSGSFGTRIGRGILFEEISALARSDEETFIVDKLAPTVYVFGRGGVLHHAFGEYVLEQPGAVAVGDYQRVFVADLVDNTIQVFRGPEHETAIQGDDFPEFSFQHVFDLWYSDGFLYVADGLNGRVGVLRVLPPCA